MQPNNIYKNLDLGFWANVKLLNQKLGYTERRSKTAAETIFLVPSQEQISNVFKSEKLDVSLLIQHDSLTDIGTQVKEYMRFRGDFLTELVRPNLMDAKQAKELFMYLKEQFSGTCPLPINKQSGEKKDHAFLTGMVNMLIDKHKGTSECDYDPREFITATTDDRLVRTLSRRVDGAFPTTKDPTAIWEIKEYYYTTSFGSRVADGVYETQLDGWELWEMRTNLQKEILHYLIIDGYYTWWECGKSYLCRLVDAMHMGLVTEVLFGKEIIERIPQLVAQWTGEKP